MSSISNGRGRGWLNLKKLPIVGTAKPLPPNNTLEFIQSQLQSVNINVHQTEETMSMDFSEKYTNLINTIQEMNEDDDSIKLGGKIKSITEQWQKSCQNENDVLHSLDIIHQACLRDVQLASKLILLLSTKSFLAQEIHGKNICIMFIRKLQSDFESRKDLQKANPTAFRNAVQMLGEFYEKVRSASGEQFTIMITPLTSYLDMLLESADIDDLELFITLILMNGESIEKECPEQITQVINKARLLLVSDRQLVKDSKLLLMLAVEIASNEYRLPIKTYKFYRGILKKSTLARKNKETYNCPQSTNNKKISSFTTSSNISSQTNSGKNFVTDSSGKSDARNADDSNETPTSYSTTSNISTQSSSGNNSVADSSEKFDAKDTTASSFREQVGPISGVSARLYRYRTITD